MKKFFNEWVYPLFDLATLLFSLGVAFYLLVFGKEFVPALAGVALLISVVNRLKIEYVVENRLNDVEAWMCGRDDCG